MSNFSNAFERMADSTLSENNGKVFSTTGSALLDLFANIGGMRNRDMADVVKMWRNARVENEELADNLVLYVGDIRNGGLGERKIRRALLRELALIDPHKIERNFDTIVESFRWDDLYIFIGTPVEKAMWDYIKEQFKKDVGMMCNVEKR